LSLAVDELPYIESLIPVLNDLIAWWWSQYKDIYGIAEVEEREDERLIGRV
jgi:hypothetical protein